MIKLITSLVAALTVTSVHAQTTLRDLPKLVVGITIDELRGDYLELFKSTFGKEGFNKLFDGGLVYEDISFDNSDLNEVTPIATIYTGALPYYHGITAEQIYSPSENAMFSIFFDKNNKGKIKLSPQSIQVSTIADELKTATNGRSDIFSLSFNASQALISGGHFANGVYWIDDITGSWITSEYYKEGQRFADYLNKSGNGLTKYTSSTWQPLLASNQYNISPYTKSSQPFSYQFSKKNTPYYKELKKSPFVNDAITKAAIDVMQKDEMGKRSAPDFLALTLYAGNGNVDSDYSLEIQDLYARLDNNLSEILSQIDKSVGLQNTFIFMTSSGCYKSNNQSYTTGYFYPHRCEALLNMYLMAIYGKEQWVRKYDNQQIYLDRSLINARKVDLVEIQNKAAEFVTQIAGVQDAISTTRLLSGNTDNDILKFRNFFNKDYPSDIIVEIHPGYEVINSTNSSAQSENKIQKQAAVSCPLVFFGYGIKSQRIKRVVRATEIAPTVCRVLRIRSPNAAKDQVLSEFL